MQYCVLQESEYFNLMSSVSLNRGRSPRNEVGQFPLTDPLQGLVNLELNIFNYHKSYYQMCVMNNEEKLLLW